MSETYIALIDGENGAIGVTFPDLPGCTAMGVTIEDAQRNAAEALRDWVEVAEARGWSVPAPSAWSAAVSDPENIEAVRAGAMWTRVPLVRENSRPVKANLSLDSSVLAAIDATADRLKVTRSAVVELLAKRGLHELA